MEELQCFTFSCIGMAILYIYIYILLFLVHVKQNENKLSKKHTLNVLSASQIHLSRDIPIKSRTTTAGLFHTTVTATEQPLYVSAVA